MLHDLEAADGWAELTYDEQTERIRTAFDAQLERDKAEDTRRLRDNGKMSNKPLCKHGDCKRQCLGREGIRGTIHVVDQDSNLVCPMYRCEEHGGRSAGAQPCTKPGCNKCSHNGKSAICNPINSKLREFRYCNPAHKAADAPRRQLFEDIRDKLGQNNPTVQAKLTALSDLHNKKDDNMPFDTALAQLKNILSTGTLQALQDALDAGPSGAGGV